MRDLNLRIGTGTIPEEVRNFQPVDSLKKWIGLKGNIRLHLYGEWETLVSPQDIRTALMNWYPNYDAPIVTISL